jgi:mannose-6-phosphate isomerase-like protein (cupin superfamily)
MKRLHTAMAAATLLAFGVGSHTVYTQGGVGAAPQTPPRQWWVNKDTAGQYGTNKPHIKLADLKARHKGQTNWMEVVIDDENYHSTYHSAAPGTRFPRRVHPDTRKFWVVVEGELRFTIDGQPEPVAATKGSIVQAPRKTVYSLEVTGTAPALWVEANQQNFKTLYPIEEAPPAQAAGHSVMKVAVNLAPAPYTGNNKPHFNLHAAAAAAGNYTGQNVVQDEHMWAQAIYGYEKNLPPYNPNDKGHFHIGAAEWWVIMAGQIRHNIETIGDFTSNEGDIVYAPPSTWHATRFAGPGPSCRLAISTYQFTSLVDAPQP